MFRRPPEVWSLVSDNASISGTGKARMGKGAFTLGKMLRRNWYWKWVTKKSTGLFTLGAIWCDVMGRHKWRAARNRSRPNWIVGPRPKSGLARKLKCSGPENEVSRWRWPHSDIYSQNDHFGLVYDMIYRFLGMEAKNCKFGMFCQQCHPSVAPGDGDIQLRNASRILTCHLVTS